MSVTPETILQGLAGWEHASIDKLHGGMSNHSWLVEADGRKAVLKIDERPRSAPYNSRQREAEIQSAAAAAELAGNVMYATDTVYMTEYLEGCVWSRDDLVDADNLARLGQALRRLHALPLSGKAFDARQAARHYARRIESDDLELLRESLEIVDTMPAPRRACCCHNDLVAENIVASPEIRFLDWEYACDNDPLFDLATVVEHHELSSRQALHLLDAYFDGNGERWLEQLGLYQRFYDALVRLWQAART